MSELGPLIHTPKRLRLMAVLTAGDSAEFAYLQQLLDLAAPDLSKQVKALKDAGYAKVSKTGRGPGSSTWVAATRAGRRAYASHVAALRQLIDDPLAAAGSASPGDPDP